MTVTEAPTTRPKPKRLAFSPPATGVGIAEVDSAFATAAQLTAELTDASRAVDRAERSYKKAEANNVDTREAAAARLAGEPAPPSTLARLRAEWDAAKTERAVLEEARAQARRQARGLLEANRDKVTKSHRTAEAKAAAEATKALDAALEALGRVAHARGVLAYLDDPSLFRPAVIAVDIGRGEAFGAAPFLSALAADLEPTELAADAA